MPPPGHAIPGGGIDDADALARELNRLRFQLRRHRDLGVQHA